MKHIDEILEKASQKTEATVAVAVAEDAHVLESVAMAKKLNIANFILVGDENKIKEQAKKVNISLNEHKIIHTTDPMVAVKLALLEVSESRANAVMKGLIDTSVIMKQALDKELGLRTGKKLSHLAVFEVPAYHKMFFITDAALNISPDVEAKKDIIQNAIDAAIKLGIKNPKVALLCAKEKVDEKMPVTLEYQELIKMNKDGIITSGIVDGPFALDNAISYESAKIKGIHSEVAGDADILLCPNIEAGNILYKALAFLTDSKNGGVILGTKSPIILTSRADSSESKLLSIALGVLFN